MAADSLFRPGDVYRRVTEILESLGLRYSVGGSIASSVRGLARSTQDMDVLVELPEEKVPALVAAFSGEFYIAEPAVREAIRGHKSFNVIHTQAGLKADLFIAGASPLDEPQLSRATREELDPDSGATAMVCSSEDIVLVKLDWYRRGRRVSERQLEDAKNVVKTDRRIGLDYLRKVAERVGLSELLEQVLRESGRA